MSSSSNYKYVKVLDDLADVTVQQSALVEEGEICDHLLSVFKHNNIHHVELAFGAVDYIFPPTPMSSVRHHTLATQILNIINRHLRGERDILMCQDELIEAGFAGVANL